MSTETVVAKFSPHGARFAKPMEDAAIEFGITSTKAKAHFIGQTAAESSDFAKVIEGLNYSAQGLADTWPNRYAIDSKAKVKRPNDLAIRLQRKPEEIANVTYANRLGNGAASTGDGWKYRGRGPIQLTGKDNYRACSLDLFKDLRLVDNPDLVLDPVIGARVAGWFWSRARLNPWAEMDDVLAVSRGINLGDPRSTKQPIGLDHRAKSTQRALRLFAELKGAA